VPKHLRTNAPFILYLAFSDCFVIFIFLLDDFEIRLSQNEETRDSGPCSFTAFWDTYPKKVGKLVAKEAWNRIKPSAELHGWMDRARDNHKKGGAIMAISVTDTKVRLGRV
jgi:hypothetical protein